MSLRRSLRKLSTDVGPMTELRRDFLDPKGFISSLREGGVSFFSGVPDSLLKDFTSALVDTVPEEQNFIAPNEGSAIGVAAGHQIACGGVPLVYLQNSGLGNTVNPLLSLCHADVYSIPMLLLVGWRGEPGKQDEPQHRVQGALTPGMLASMDVPFEVLPDYEEGADAAIQRCIASSIDRSAPVALLVKRQTFSPYSLTSTSANAMDYNGLMSREEALRSILPSLPAWSAVVSSTGFTSREVFELREEFDQGHAQDFLTVGSMGHASAIATGCVVITFMLLCLCLHVCQCWSVIVLSVVTFLCASRGVYFVCRCVEIPPFSIVGENFSRHPSNMIGW